MLMYTECCYFFFFKQKTAYEMRISDWSSDVCSSDLGDGAGILTQVPDAFFREVCGFDLPEAGSYAVGIGFLPKDAAAADKAADAIAKIVDSEGLRLLGWREVPIDDSMIGRFAQDAQPTFRQLFVAGAEGDRKSTRLNSSH